MALRSQHVVDPRVAWEAPMDGVELELGCVSTVDKRHRLSPSLLGLSQCLATKQMTSLDPSSCCYRDALHAGAL